MGTNIQDAQEITYSVIHLLQTNLKYQQSMEVLGVICCTLDGQPNQDIVVKLNHKSTKQKGRGGVWLSRNDGEEVPMSHSTPLRTRAVRGKAPEPDMVVLDQDDEYGDYGGPTVPKQNSATKLSGTPTSHTDSPTPNHRLRSEKRQGQMSTLGEPLSKRRHMAETSSRDIDQAETLELTVEDIQEPDQRYTQPQRRKLDTHHVETLDLGTRNKRGSSLDEPYSEDSMFAIKDEPLHNDHVKKEIHASAKQEQRQDEEDDDDDDINEVDQEDTDDFKIQINKDTETQDKDGPVKLEIIDEDDEDDNNDETNGDEDNDADNEEEPSIVAKDAETSQKSGGKESEDTSQKSGGKESEEASNEPVPSTSRVRATSFISTKTKPREKGAKMSKIDSKIEQIQTKKYKYNRSIHIRTEMRLQYNYLTAGGAMAWDFDYPLDSENNSTLTRALLQKIKADSGGDTSFTDGNILGHIKTYFISKQDRNNRIRNKTYNKHKKGTKRMKRKRNKLKARQKAGESMDFESDDIKKNIDELLRIDFMSSEDSTDAEHDPKRPKSRKVREHMWMSEQARNLKAQLDKEALKEVKQYHQAKRGKIIRGVATSETEPPRDTPKWILKECAKMVKETVKEMHPTVQQATHMKEYLPNHAIQSHVKAQYKALVKEGKTMWDLSDSINSQRNYEFTNLLLKRVKEVSQCKDVTEGNIHGHILCYFKTKRTGHERVQKGEYSQHVKSVRLLARKKRKLNNRKKASGGIHWENEQRKMRVVELLHTEYMSSEESAEEEQNIKGPKTRQVREYTWMSQEAKTIKSILDEAVGRGSTSKLRGHVIRGAIESDTAPPDNAPNWIIKK